MNKFAAGNKMLSIVEDALETVESQMEKNRFNILVLYYFILIDNCKIQKM